MSEVTPKSLFREAKEVLRGGRDRKDDSPIGPVLSYIDNLQKKSPPVQMAVGGVAGLMSLEAVRPFLPYLLVPVGLYAAARFLRWLVPGPQRQSTLKLRDKTVLITGASQGLGKALAFEFYRAGAKLILTARSQDKLKELVDELKASGPGHEPVYRRLDVSNPVGVEELPTLALDGKTIDVLVNNAGSSMRGSCLNTPLEVHRQLFDVNYFGAVAVTRALYNSIPDSGAIVVISSMQGRLAIPYRCAYSASKHALQAFFDSFRAESRPNLQILVVSASYMNTGFGSRALDASGKPVGREDDDQKKGYSPEYSARTIVEATRNRKTELILAPFSQKFAIFLRWFFPDLLFYLLHRRSLKDPIALEEKKQQ